MHSKHLIAVYLQIVNAKFHKVVSRHYLCEVENIYITLRQIHLGKCIPITKLIRIDGVLQKI